MDKILQSTPLEKKIWTCIYSNFSKPAIRVSLKKFSIRLSHTISQVGGYVNLAVIDFQTDACKKTYYGHVVYYANEFHQK